MVICGVYCITNEVNGKQYIGLSNNCIKRWQDHYSKSYTSKRKDDLEKPLYRAMRKYGRENFSFKIIEECLSDVLKEREIYWINQLSTYKNGYNATLGGDLSPVSPLKGEKHGMSKLTESDVIKCRKLYAQGVSSKKVWSEKYSKVITYAGFQRMWHGKTWKHVMPEVFLNNPRPRRKITKAEILEIKSLFKSGMTCAEVYHYFDQRFSRTTINDIFHEKRYKEIS